jgi:aminoglycoside phosphotransferase (APT) family kinase protein
VPQWTPEIVVDEQLARHLLAAQFPELDLRSLRLLATGWDNTVWIVDERWAFRFPRREIAVPLLERELAVLPHLERLVPLAVPVPRFVGEASASYPWPFLGSDLLPGRELGSVPLDGEHDTAAAVALAHFLRILHSSETLALIPARERLPEDPNGRADMTRRVPRAREALVRLERDGLWHPPASVEPLLESALALPASSERTLVHGDLHFRHVLVDQSRMSGVVDWGDVCIADPSVDLQLVWSFFSPGAWQAFLDEYGEIPRRRELRARALGFSLNAMLALYGRDESLPDVERAALASLDRLAASR